MGFAIVRRRRTSLKAENNSAAIFDAALPYRSDPALVRGCLKGDESAWVELVERYARLIYSIPRHYGLCEADAEDVMQNVFVIVYRRLKTLRDQQRLSAWLIETAHHETIHWLKRAGREIEVGLSDPELQRIEQRELLRQALERLSPTERKILLAVFANDTPLRDDEIATELGIAPGSLGPARARAFRKLEAILKEMGFEVSAATTQEYLTHQVGVYSADVSENL